MSDTDKPSIAELQRVAPALMEMRDTLARKEAEPLVHRAAPVLIEIVAAAQAWMEAATALDDAMVALRRDGTEGDVHHAKGALAARHTAERKLTAALAKVRP